MRYTVVIDDREGHESVELWQYGCRLGSDKMLEVGRRLSTQAFIDNVSAEKEPCEHSPSKS